MAWYRYYIKTKIERVPEQNLKWYRNWYNTSKTRVVTTSGSILIQFYLAKSGGLQHQKLLISPQKLCCKYFHLDPLQYTISYIIIIIIIIII